jgi:hypothetical protein
MAEYSLCESDYLAAIQAAVAIEALTEVMDCMTYLAEFYIREGLTREAAEVLAFVMLRSETAADTYQRAADLFLELESRICPSVILDARRFAHEATLRDMIAYVFAEDAES